MAAQLGADHAQMTIRVRAPSGAGTLIETRIDDDGGDAEWAVTRGALHHRGPVRNHALICQLSCRQAPAAPSLT